MIEPKEYAQLEMVWLFLVAVLFTTTGYNWAEGHLVPAVSQAVFGVGSIYAYLVLFEHYENRVRLNRLRDQVAQVLHLEEYEAERVEDRLRVIGYTKGDTQSN